MNWIITLLAVTFVFAQDSPPLKKVHVRGTDLAYVDQGRGEPVVLIHGWLNDYRTWSAQWPELSKHFRVIAYSRRYNYPNTPSGGGSDYSKATDAADLVALIQTLKLGPVHLVAHSAGSYVALLVTREHPELVRTLVLAEGGAPGLLDNMAETKSQPRNLVKDAGAAFQKGDVEGAARVVVEGVIGPGTYQNMPQNRRDRLLQNLRLELKAQLAAPRETAPRLSCDDVHRINVPTLLVEGELTKQNNRLMVRELKRCLPNSEKEILPQATHALHLDNPSAFNAMILRFLTRHRR